MLRLDKKIIKTLSSMWRKVELVATHMCKALPNMVLKILTIQDSSTAWTVRIVFRLCKSIILMPRTKLLCIFGVQWFILNTQKVLISLKLKLSVCWNFSGLVSSENEQSKVLSSAPRRTSINSRETHTSLAFQPWILVTPTVFRISEAVPSFQNGLGPTPNIEFFHIWYSAMRLIVFVYVTFPTNTEE